MFVSPDVEPESYSYLLGLYLGDGCILWTGRTWQLRIVLDGAYPGIIDESAAAVRATVGHGRAHVHPRPRDGGVEIQSGWKRWDELFPQRGPGRKHLRPIVLEPWQQHIVDAHPGAFVRGLIHSDGCRCVNRFRTKLPSGRVAEYAYPRYFFSNLSADIRALFCEACERLGLRWTQSNHRNISIAHRASVTRLDELVGPKA
jgi:hypothetical protein